MSGRTVVGEAAGMRVEIDASNCIVIVSPRQQSDDEEITVTNVDLLCAALQYAKQVRDVREQGDPDDPTLPEDRADIDAHAAQDRLAETGAYDTTERVYVGTRDDQSVMVHDDGDVSALNDLSTNAEGFSWGYGGHGPRNLARSLLRDALSATGNFSTSDVSTLVRRHYLTFMADVVERWPRANAWAITRREIVDWVVAKEKRLAKEKRR